MCDATYLAVDCSVQSTMQPIQLIGGNYTTYWAIANGFFYHRIVAVTAVTGWAGVLFGAVDRMTNGRGHIVTVPSAFNGTVYDVYATAKHTPLFTNSIVLGATGFSGKNTIDVSYYRPTSTSADHHYSIPEQPGTITNMSVAFQSHFFEFHKQNADFIQIDLAKAALSNAQSS